MLWFPSSFERSRVLPRFRPSLERLETRDTPSTVTLNLAYQQQDLVTLYGQVLDDAPSGLTVNFTGQYVGAATTDNDGNFSITVPAGGLGAIEAIAIDSVGQPTDPAQVTVASADPIINSFSA